ncbi:hypothetical protein [Pedobacter immunditicola]|uniref:hypothetical protein n=1 Tax=Pedobacter immunditicola TaxID=3133440 RepID=UPI003096AD09
MMLKKQFLLFLLIGAFSLHLGHQLFPHHHHEQGFIASYHHEHHNAHHHHHSSTFPTEQKKKKWFDELLSLINHGNTESPIQSSNQLKTDVCKIIPIILPGFNRLQSLSLEDYILILPIYSPPEDKPTKHLILFKNRRGPPVMA